jgi:ribose 5-phosphate isomerase RpiB
MTKLGRKIGERVLAQTGDATNVQKYLSGEFEGKKPITRLGVMEDNIEKILKKRREM